MTLDNFKALPWNDQCQCVMDYAEFVLERKWGRNDICLYTLDTIFEELYDQRGQVVRMNAFDDVSGLDRYLRWVRVLYNYGVITLNPRTGEPRR